MKMKLKSFCRHCVKSVQLLWTTSPFLFSMRLCIELATSLSPVLNAFLTKLIIDALSNGTLPYAERAETLFRVLILFVVVQLINMLLGRVISLVTANHQDLINHQIDIQIKQKINELDISCFDNPAAYNEIENAHRDSGSLAGLSMLMVTIIKGAFLLVTNCLLMFRYGWWFALLITFFLVPSIFVDRHVARKKYDWQRSRTINERKIGYVNNILAGQSYAKDIRVFHSYRYFLSAFQNLWTAWFKEKRKIDRQRFVYSLLAQAAPFIPISVILFYIVFQILGGSMTIGDFTYVNGIVMQFFAGISMLFSALNNGYESEMRLTNFDAFMAWKPQIRNNGKRVLDRIRTIEFRHVSFRYPKTRQLVLQDINFVIEEQEKVALVGVNGAGKSTIIKLLLRLYDSEDGQILINGTDIREYTLESLHGAMGVVFQDFNQYLLQLDQAVAVSSPLEPVDEQRIAAALEKADFAVDKRFAGGMRTYLGKIFDEEGVVLSGGQWQKLAIAQAYYRQSSAMILDEPNASLDPEAEYHLFEKLKDLCSDKIALFITHRLSCVSMADKIIVINHGRCEEIGTHEQLMDNNGTYAKLYTYQAEKYIHPAVGV